jgi:ubiquinone/menaquinone biosynthesis C-methylase UbiE
MIRSSKTWRRAACAAVLSLAVAAGIRAQEANRDEWQKVDAIFEALGVRPGATIADVGAGDGFFTARLAKKVGDDGRVYAVDVSDSALGRLRRRVEKDALANVTVVEGAEDDPKLPAGSLDAALIVNAYHEMREHQAVLTAIRLALKPEGRLVIVEPISKEMRSRPRERQTRDHEIAPDFVQEDAKAAGFRIVSLEDPFTERRTDRATEWMLVFAPQPATLSRSQAR